jgi:outer membrane biogenesis lipoprotein LolB
MMKKIAFFPLLLCVLLFAACARQPAAPADPQQAAAAWQRYSALTQAYSQPVAARQQISLRFGKQGDTRRVTALLWGNTAKQLVRLDVNAGVGASIANIEESPEKFLFFAQQENKAYFAHQGQRPLLRIGMPIPLRIASVFALLNGDYAALFGTSYALTELEKGTILYILSGGELGGALILDEQGRPQQWRQDGSKGWQMSISYAEDNLPYRIELSHPQGHSALMLVKNREQLTSPFTEKQMRLIIPQGTALLPLEAFVNKNK